MTAFSGERAPLFSRAIMINPTWDISPDDNAVAVAMERVRRYSGLSVDDIRDLDDIPSADLQEVNRETIEASPRGRFTYGPPSLTIRRLSLRSHSPFSEKVASLTKYR